jgi:hypothetical protein
MAAQQALQKQYEAMLAERWIAQDAPGDGQVEVRSPCAPLRRNCGPLT